LKAKYAITEGVELSGAIPSGSKKDIWLALSELIQT
jgi:hypothetical protein